MWFFLYLQTTPYIQEGFLFCFQNKNIQRKELLNVNLSFILPQLKMVKIKQKENQTVSEW